MARYAIGDIQGCFESLEQLLHQMPYEPGRDELWLVGDLINRGPRSLETLRWASQQPNLRCVLGNHDLNLLAVSQGHRAIKKRDTLRPILEASDRDHLLDWLREQPMLVIEEDWVMVHAGLLPAWDLEMASEAAEAVEETLRRGRESAGELFGFMYGDRPDRWREGLDDEAYLRLTINAMTRMRVLSVEEQRLELSYKSTFEEIPEELAPWFAFCGSPLDTDLEDQDKKVVFGHWSALGVFEAEERYYCLDDGCVWGNRLVGMRLEDEEIFAVDAVE